MEAGAFGYIRGGSEDEWTMKENTTSFNTKKIMPRILRGIDSADLHTSVFGIELDTPIIQAPSAAQGLAHEKGEADTAKGVAAAGSIFPSALMQIRQSKTQPMQRQAHRSFSNYI